MIPTRDKDPTDVVGRRIFAFVLDAILITGIVVIVGALVAKRYTNAPSDACTTLREQSSGVKCLQIGSHVYSLSSTRTNLLWFTGLAATFLDFVVLPGVTGASIGKLMIGLRTVDANGQMCGFGKAFGRTVLLIVDLFFLIGLFVVLSTKPHKRIGDNVAGTYVVDASDVGAPVERVVVPEFAYAEQPGPWGGAPQQPAWGAQPAPPPPPAWGAPQPAPRQQQPPPPPAPAPSPAPTAPAPEAPSSDESAPGAGESWWDSALGDDEPRQ